MKIGHTIDAQGYYTGDVLEGSGIEPNVTVICPDGFFKAHWNGTQWVEGLTQAEIDAIRNMPVPKTEDEKTIDKLKSDNEQMNLQIIDLFEQLVEKGLL